MLINGIKLPEADMRGRAFPYNTHGPHYLGPCIVNGTTYVMKIWENKTQEGRSYLRIVFETPEEAGFSED